MMTKKSNDEIIISKSKLFKVLAISLGVIILIIICFLISSNDSETYKAQTTSSSDAVEEEDVLQKAIQEAGEVSDEERTQPDAISIDEYIDLYNGNENELVLLSRPTCQYCKIATPILENIIYKYGVKINYLNTDELDDEANSKLISSDEYFKEGYGTPLLLVVSNGSIVDKIDGLVTREEYISFFQKYQFME